MQLFKKSEQRLVDVPFIPQSARGKDTLTTHKQAARTAYVPGLPLLRGLAALSVGLFHYTGPALPKLYLPQMQQLFKNGWLGVEVFFVISGFVIPYSLFGKNYSPKKFIAYITKRIVRINPPAYIALLLMIAQWYAIDYLIANDRKYTHDLSIARVVHNILFTVPISDYKWILGIFWTLAIEFQFYFVVGVLFNLLFEKRSLVYFVVFFLLFSLFNHLPAARGDNFLHFSSLFAMGGLTLYRHRRMIDTRFYLLLMMLFSVVAYFEIGMYQAVAGIVSSLAILYLKTDNRFTRFLGNISYSFYLLHLLIGQSLEFLLVRLISPTTDAAKIIMLLSCLGLAIAGSYLFCLLIERPFMKLASSINT